MAWKFFRYVGPEGKDVIADWIKKQPAGTSGRLLAALDVAVSELELVNSDQFTRLDGVGQLRRKCTGFYELVLRVDGVQYRPIGMYGPGRREFTLLSMDKEKGKKLIEDPECERPRRRRDAIKNRSHIREYFPTRTDR